MPAPGALAFRPAVAGHADPLAKLATKAVANSVVDLVAAPREPLRWPGKTRLSGGPHERMDAWAHGR